MPKIFRKHVKLIKLKVPKARAFDPDQFFFRLDLYQGAFHKFSKQLSGFLTHPLPNASCELTLKIDSLTTDVKDCLVGIILLH